MTDMAEKFWAYDTKGYPCKDCQERHRACWQDCERYKQAKRNDIDRKRKKAEEKKKKYEYLSTRGNRYEKIQSCQGRPESWKKER